MTYAETVPSWFVLNLKVSKIRETYYIFTKFELVILKTIRIGLEKGSRIYTLENSERERQATPSSDKDFYFLTLLPGVRKVAFWPVPSDY